MPTPKPLKVSVVTAAYNAALTLPDTLRSVAGQSYPMVEHIVIDGGSKDTTAEVIAQHGGHLAHFVSESDCGIYDAMNKGIALASGDIICFLNADDVYAHADVLDKVAQAMQADDLDAQYGDVALFHSERPQHLVRRYRSSRFSPARIAWGWMPAHPALFVHRRVFEWVGPFKIDYRIAGDFEFIARAFRLGELRYRHIPEVLVHMRTGGVSTRGWRNTLLLNREVLRACRENGIYTNALMLLSKYPYKLLEFILP